MRSTSVRCAVKGSRPRRRPRLTLRRDTRYKVWSLSCSAHSVANCSSHAVSSTIIWWSTQVTTAFQPTWNCNDHWEKVCTLYVHFVQNPEVQNNCQFTVYGLASIDSVPWFYFKVVMMFEKTKDIKPQHTIIVLMGISCCKIYIALSKYILQLYCFTKWHVCLFL